MFLLLFSKRSAFETAHLYEAGMPIGLQLVGLHLTGLTEVLSADFVK
jgi:hypothetical protein